MSGGEEARECGSGGLWTLRGGVKVGAEEGEDSVTIPTTIYFYAHWKSPAISVRSLQ